MKAAGLNGIAISLDHFDPNEHNAFRGNSNSFEWVDQSVSHCLEVGILVALNVCPTRALVDEYGVERIIERANVFSFGETIAKGIGSFLATRTSDLFRTKVVFQKNSTPQGRFGIHDFRSPRCAQFYF